MTGNPTRMLIFQVLFTYLCSPDQFHLFSLMPCVIQTTEFTLLLFNTDFLREFAQFGFISCLKYWHVQMWTVMLVCTRANKHHVCMAGQSKPWFPVMTCNQLFSLWQVCLYFNTKANSHMTFGLLSLNILITRCQICSLEWTHLLGRNIHLSFRIKAESWRLILTYFNLHTPCTHTGTLEPTYSLFFTFFSSPHWTHS